MKYPPTSNVYSTPEIRAWNWLLGEWARILREIQDHKAQTRATIDHAPGAEPQRTGGQD